MFNENGQTRCQEEGKCEQQTESAGTGACEGPDHTTPISGPLELLGYVLLAAFYRELGFSPVACALLREVS